MSAAPVVKKVAMKPKVAASHPPFAKMIVEAVKDLKEKKGSSRQAILKHIIALHKIDEKVASVQVRRGLVSAVKAGHLSQTKGSGASGSFKLVEKVKPAAKKDEDGKLKKVVKEKVAKKSAAKSAGVKKVKKAAPTGAKKPKTPKKKAAAKPKKASLKPKKPTVKSTPKKSVIKQ